MENEKLKFCFLSIFMAFTLGCSAQEAKVVEEENVQLYNRQPAVAGQFYPGNKQELQNMLKDLFSKAEPGKGKNTIAVISPHAGYVYSGIVAASSFNQVDPTKTYENIFVIASSHRAYYDGASIYSIGNYVTPLGEVKVNIELATKLIDEHEVFDYVAKAHVSEHSLEVQLPFLQYYLEKDFQIVPIVIGAQLKDVCEKMADALLPYFNEKNLFVISSDFSHYPEYEEANKWDVETANSILLNDPDKFYATVHTNKDDAISNLSTRACGWTSTLTLLYMTVQFSYFEYEHILYKNSGDTDFGDKNRVVGYNSIVVSKKGKTSNPDEFILTDKDKQDLLNIARNTVTEYVENKNIPEIDDQNYSETLKTHCGAFVTLNKFHRLRGCIGRFDAKEPLNEVVQQMAIAAATQDTRFTPVMEYELEDIEIEISVLTPMKKINSIDEIELGKHGIYIKQGYRTGTFLPQVATDTGWTLEEFLGHCARDKAGIGWDGWKDADVFIYEAEVFTEGHIK